MLKIDLYMCISSITSFLVIIFFHCIIPFGMISNRNIRNILRGTLNYKILFKIQKTKTKTKNSFCKYWTSTQKVSSKPNILWQINIWFSFHYIQPLCDECPSLKTIPEKLSISQNSKAKDSLKSLLTVE